MSSIVAKDLMKATNFLYTNVLHNENLHFQYKCDMAYFLKINVKSATAEYQKQYFSKN